MAVTEEATSKLELNKQYRSAKVSVWWDCEKWDDYMNLDPRQIKDNIRSALDRAGYTGSVSIFCYVDEATKIPQHVHTSFSLGGISIRQYPRGKKLAMVLVHMVMWGDYNPPPANYLFITDDENFTAIIKHLALCDYQILLALSPNATSIFVSDPKAVWLLPSLFSGGSPISKKKFLQLEGYWSDNDEIITGSDDDEIITEGADSEQGA